MHSGRCPVCFLLRRDKFDELSRWVGGDVADQQNRQRLEQAGGFCNSHFWLLNELHSPQSGARLNDFIATRLVGALRDCADDDRQAQVAWLREAATRCPVCARLRACEATHVRAFVAWLSDSVAWAEYQPNHGACACHTCCAAKGWSGPVAA